MSDIEYPFLVSIPHASPRVPKEVKKLVALNSEELLGYTDLYTDQIFDVPGVHKVEAEYSRMIVDMNRAPDDISKEYEQAEHGVAVLTTWDGKSVYKEEPSHEVVSDLISNYHKPYHDQIEATIPKVQFLFDCHSFLPVGPKLRRDSGEERPDIDLGNRNFSTCSREHTVFIRDFFQDLGYSVAINFPYAGNYIINYHCHRRKVPPFLVPGMQLEINQGLYVKEDSFDPIPERVDEFHDLFKKLLDAFMVQFCLSGECS